MYKDGAHVTDIAQACKCSVKTVYKITSECGVHRRTRVHKKDEKPGPAHNEVEPMYREIPSHMVSEAAVNDRQKKLLEELRAYRETHVKPWYLMPQKGIYQRTKKNEC